MSKRTPRKYACPSKRVGVNFQLGETIHKFAGSVCGDWKVIEYIGESKWKCECVLCSKISYVKAWNLIHHAQCLDCYHKRTRLPYIVGEISNRAWTTILKRLIRKTKVLKLDITPEYIWDLYLRQERKCSLSGLNLYMAKYSKDYDKGEYTASLDRIDSNLGYIEGNVQWVHKRVNLIKSELEQDYFINICHLISYKDKDLGWPYIPKIFKKHHYWNGCGELSHYHYNSIKLKSRNRNFEFKISIEDLWDLFIIQNARCKLSNLPIQLSLTGKQHRDCYQTASVDRIDSNKGYVLDNVQWVHKDVNRMKKDFPEKDFLFYCKSISDYQQRLQILKKGQSFLDNDLKRGMV